MTLSDTFHAWRDRAARERELAHIPPEEIAGYGMGPEDFRALARMALDQVARMEQMARLHGVSHERLDADRNVQIEVARACQNCGAQRECRAALARGAAPEETGFCPNHATWTALAAE